MRIAAKMHRGHAVLLHDQDYLYICNACCFVNDQIQVDAGAKIISTTTQLTVPHFI